MPLEKLCFILPPEKQNIKMRLKIHFQKHYQQQRIIFTSPAFRMGIVGLFLLTPILCAWGITLFHNNMQQPKTHSSNQTIIDDNLSLKEQASYFEQALIDYIAALNSAFDGYYGYETPTEKGYSNE